MLCVLGVIVVMFCVLGVLVVMLCVLGVIVVMLCVLDVIVVTLVAAVAALSLTCWVVGLRISSPAVQFSSSCICELGKARMRFTRSLEVPPTLPWKENTARGGAYSHTGPVISGVFQNAALGPFLFRIYISHIGNGIQSSVSPSSGLGHHDPHRLQPATGRSQNTATLGERQQVSFNEENCHQLTVTKETNRIPDSYTFNNQTLERVTSAT